MNQPDERPGSIPAADPSEAEARYRSLFENMSEGLAHHRMIFEAGQPQDYIFLEVNPAFEMLTGLKEVVGRRVTEVLPDIRESQPELFEVYGRVALSGRPEKLEIYVTSLEAWFSISVYSTQPEHFTAVFENVTERKQAAEALAESERRYRLLFNSVNDAVFVQEGMSEEGLAIRFLEVNDVACQRLGYTREELLCLGPAEIEVAESRSGAPRIQELMASGNSAVWEGVQVTKDGRKIPVEISSRRLHLNGRATYLSTVRDITKRKAAEQALSESEGHFRGLYEESPVAYHSLDAKGKILHVNQAWLRLLGYPAQEVMGRWFGDFLVPGQTELFRTRFPRFAEFGEIRDVEFDLVRKDGTIVSVSADGRISHDANSEFLRTHCVLHNISARKLAEAAVQRSQAELEAIYDSTPLMMCLVNRDRKVERMNRSMAELVADRQPSASLLGPGDLLGCVNALDHPQGCGFGTQCECCPLRLGVMRTFHTGQPCRQIETRMLLLRAGVRREIQVCAYTALVRVRDQPKVLVCLDDITGRKQLESQFLQAQKMEAIGQLAGGVAHDFNNILAATLLHLQLLQQRENLDPDLVTSLRELEQGTQRAASLTRQLLLFSRRQVMQTTRVELNEVVRGLLKMLNRLLGEHIETAFNQSAEPVWVEADPGMLEQVIMNLCVNARDSMPRGGQLKLGVRPLTLEADTEGRHPEARPGSFACFTVADTGAGMDETTLQRIFEPFFTTKEPGKGTGLGLATVHGIARQHHGWVEVESAVGIGTTFRVFLPAAVPPASAIAPEDQATIRGGTETILLVEDDERVRRLVKMTLRLFGYEVIEACNGAEALQLWESEGHRVNLLFTDMVMPGGLTGLDLAERLQEFKPELKVVISSGYAADLLPQSGGLLPGMTFLAKPYAPNSLARAVRECLDREA